MELVLHTMSPQNLNTLYAQTEISPTESYNKQTNIDTV